jgi:ketosteroid isomerase-like protein
MRMAWVGVAMAAAGLVGCASARPAARAAPEDELRIALARWNDAATRGDLPAFMAQFDDAPDLLLVGSDKGEVFRGRAAIEGWLSRLFKGARFSWTIDRADVGGSGDVAWVFVEGAMNVSDKAGKPRGSTPYRFSGVLVRRDGGWAWRQWHGSIPRAE